MRESVRDGERVGEEGQMKKILGIMVIGFCV